MSKLATSSMQQNFEAQSANGHEGEAFVAMGKHFSVPPRLVTMYCSLAQRAAHSYHG